MPDGHPVQGYVVGAPSGQRRGEADHNARADSARAAGTVSAAARRFLTSRPLRWALGAAAVAFGGYVPGVAGLVVGGVIGSGVGVSDATWMMGYARALRRGDARPDPGTRVEGTNGITVQVADGLAWVYPGAGGPGHGSCADPSSGDVLARLKLPQADRLLAIGPHQLCYAAPAPDGSEYVDQEPLPGGCRAG